MYVAKVYLLIFTVFFIISCSDRQDEAGDQGNGTEIMKVSVVSPAKNFWERELLLTGEVRAKDKVAISSAISGLQIMSVVAEIGDCVTKGQTLAVLENVNVQAQLEQNEAQLAKARAGLSALKATVAEEKAKLDRRIRLLNHNAISREEYEEQVLRHHNSQANLKAAEAEIRQLQAQIRDSLNQRGKAEIKSPVSGMVIARFAQVGNLTDDQVLFYLVADDNLEVVAEVSDDELRLLKPRMTADLCLKGDYADCMEGSIRITDQEIAQSSRTAKIFITPVE